MATFLKTSIKYVLYAVGICILGMIVIQALPVQLGAPLAAGTIILAKYLDHRSDHYLTGNDGELKIQKVLTQLPNEYLIIPDVQKPHGGNIDFVIVGPTGIFALEVKNPRGSFTIMFDGTDLTFNGKRWQKSPLTQTIKNAAELGDDLQKELNNPHIFVEPVLVFANPQNLHFGLHKIHKVLQVICKEFLLELLTTKGETALSAAEVEKIAEKVKTGFTKPKENPPTAYSISNKAPSANQKR